MPTARAALATLVLFAALAPAHAGAWRDGPFGWTYAVYDGRAYGPDRQLTDIVHDLGLPLTEGRLAGARLLVIKEQRRVELWVGEAMVKAYRMQLGQVPKGRKTRRGDRRTPEGEYFICDRQSGKYHRSLWLSYPNAEDAAAGVAAKRISAAQRDEIVAALARGECPPQGTRLGGALLLHGQQPSLTRAQRRTKKRAAYLQPGDADPRAVPEYLDWTSGCVALFNSDIRELHELLPARTRVTIVADGPVTRPAPAPATAPQKGAGPGGGGAGAG